MIEIKEDRDIRKISGERSKELVALAMELANIAKSKGVVRSVCRKVVFKKTRSKLEYNFMWIMLLQYLGEDYPKTYTEMYLWMIGVIDY